MNQAIKGAIALGLVTITVEIVGGWLVCTMRYLITIRLTIRLPRCILDSSG